MADPIKISVQVNQPRLSITSPVGLMSGWPFGSNPQKADIITPNVPTVVDQVSMPGKYRVVKWLLLLSDDSNGLGMSSEINAFMRGGIIEFTEYAILGDCRILLYDLDVVMDGDKVNLVVTSRYAGALTVRTAKIGLFS
jgi:hypothetical protein